MPRRHSQPMMSLTQKKWWLGRSVSPHLCFRRKADTCDAKIDVRYGHECVAKLFAALRARNNRILVNGATNQRCAFSSDVESMFREQPLKIVLQHIRHESGHREYAWLAFNIRAVVALCSIPEIHCNRGRHTSARKSHRPTGAGHSNCRTRTSRHPPDRNGVPRASRPYTRHPE